MADIILSAAPAAATAEAPPLVDPPPTFFSALLELLVLEAVEAEEAVRNPRLVLGILDTHSVMDIA